MHDDEKTPRLERKWTRKFRVLEHWLKVETLTSMEQVLTMAGPCGFWVGARKLKVNRLQKAEMKPKTYTGEFKARIVFDWLKGTQEKADQDISVPRFQQPYTK